jgi:hypothetical protein
VRLLRAELGWLLLLAALLLVPLSPLLSGKSILLQHDIGASDLLHSQLPYHAFFGRSIRAGDFPLWMPDIFSGVPYVSQLEAGPFYPLNLLYAAMRPWTAFSWCAALTILIAGAGTYGFARRLGCEPGAAVVAGLAYGLSGFEVSHLKHPNMQQVAAWLPSAWWLLFEALDGWSPGWALLAGVLGLQALAGHPQITYFTLLLLGGHVIVNAWVRRRDVPSPGTSLLRFAVASAFGLGIAAVTLLPAWQFNRHSMRARGVSWDEAVRFPLAWVDLLYFVAPSLRGSVYEGTYSPPAHATLAWENYAYVGLLPLLLAGFALLVDWRRPVVRGLGAAAGAALGFALGPQTPIFKLLWEWLPGMHLFRFPVRALFVVDAALALLAGLGTAAWLRRMRRGLSDGLRIRTFTVILAGLVAVDLWASHSGELPMDDRVIWDRPSRLVQAALAENSEARIYTLDGFDLWAAAYVAAEGSRKGLEPYRALAGIPIGSSVVLGGAAAVDGYANMVHDRVAAFWLTPNRQLLAQDLRAVDLPSTSSGVIDPKFVSRLRKAAVTHVLSKKPLGAPFELVASDGAIAAYRLDGVFPRAYLASSWRPVANLAEAVTQIDSVDPKPALEGQAAPAAAEVLSLTPVRYRRPDNDTLVVDVAGHAGLLVVAESYDVGWSAAVDGRRATIVLVNGYQRGVFVPAGSREVVFRYCPAGLTLGAVLSLTCVCFSAAWCVFAWRGSFR